MKKQWWQEEVVYQIYPKSFCDSNNDGIGDLKGIISKLDYLKDLGVTMLWICPFYQSPMTDNGYDISDYQAIAEEFGTMEDAEELIEEAKQHGIKIMLDLVANHTSDQHRWFQDALKNPQSPYRDYYIFKEGKEIPNNWRSIFGGSCWEKVPDRDEYYFHVFGVHQPDLNWENPVVRQEIYQMVNWWLEKGIAGFRLDAITHMKKDLTWASREPDGVDGRVGCVQTTLNQPGLGEFLHELSRETFQKHDCVTVAEAQGVNYEQVPEFIGEDGYFSMFFDFKHVDLDVEDEDNWCHRIQWSIQDYREKLMTSHLAIQKYGVAANFLENHDQPRSTSKFLREHQNEPEAAKTLGAMNFFLRGVPFIYQGQELGMVNPVRSSMEEFDDISSIDQYQRILEEGYSEEEALHFVNLRSRDNARTPFPWTGERYGGFSEVAPWLGMAEEYPVINAKAQAGNPDSVLEFYREMLRFRREGAYHNCLVYGDIEPIDCGENVVAYKRFDDQDTLCCYFNLGAEASTEQMPKDVAVVWHTQDKPEVSDGKMLLKPWQSVIVRLQNGCK